MARAVREPEVAWRDDPHDVTKQDATISAESA